MTICPAHAGTGDATVGFLQHLRQKYASKRLLIIWDGATYHPGTEMVSSVRDINAGRTADEWLVTWCTWAPHAPEQNPMEDIWLRAKRFVRKNWRLCDHFAFVKRLFLEAIQNQ